MDYAERLIGGKKAGIYDLDKSEMYELLLGDRVSSDHARKSLKTIELVIEKCKQDLLLNDEGVKDLLEDTLQKNSKNEIGINKDGSYSSSKLIIMSEEEAKDKNFLLKSHGYSMKYWEIVSAKSSIWNANSKQDGIQTLYSSKITVKPVKSYVWNEDDIKMIFENLKCDYENKVQVYPQYDGGDDILVVPIADLHYNLLSEEYVTGNNYNLEIAEETYYYALNDIISRVKGKKFEKVVFIVGNDFINADNLDGTTTKGTPQDNHSSWFTIIDKATQLVINGIDMLTNIAPVEVKYVPSNHDLHTMFGIMQTVLAWYKNDEFVSVECSPMPRKYFKYGNVLLGLSHDIKIKNALTLMTSEAKSEWGECKNMIWMLGHLHKAMAYDKEGYMEILRLPTISGYSRWTTNSGYVQTEKKNQAFIINKNLGITDIINTIIKF